LLKYRQRVALKQECEAAVAKATRRMERGTKKAEKGGRHCVIVLVYHALSSPDYPFFSQEHSKQIEENTKLAEYTTQLKAQLVSSQKATRKERERADTEARLRDSMAEEVAARGGERKRVDKMERKISRLQGEVEQGQAAYDGLERKEERVRVKKNELAAACRNKTKKLERRDVQVETLKHNQTKLKGEVDELRETNAHLQMLLGELEAIVADMDEEHKDDLQELETEWSQFLSLQQQGKVKSLGKKKSKRKSRLLTELLAKGKQGNGRSFALIEFGMRLMSRALSGAQARGVLRDMVEFEDPDREEVEGTDYKMLVSRASLVKWRRILYPICHWLSSKAVGQSQRAHLLHDATTKKGGQGQGNSSVYMSAMRLEVEVEVDGKKQDARLDTCLHYSIPESGTSACEAKAAADGFEFKISGGTRAEAE
jgi:hypothetical protein